MWRLRHGQERGGVVVALSRQQVSALKRRVYGSHDRHDAAVYDVDAAGRNVARLGGLRGVAV